MKPAGLSGTVTISDQRSYIKIKTLHDKNPTEIHSALSEVCGEFTVDHSMVSHWANRFCGGCVNIDNYPRPGRSRTLTDGSMWQMLMKNFLEPQEFQQCQYFIF